MARSRSRAGRAGWVWLALPLLLASSPPAAHPAPEPGSPAPHAPGQLLVRFSDERALQPRTGPEGIVELGRTHEMFAIAEVYETDISKLAVGQRATIRSPALDGEVSGRVDRIGLKIGKKDVLSTDPAAKTDARVVEVEIKLDDSKAVAGMTNLQVEVFIEPRGRK